MSWIYVTEEDGNLVDEICTKFFTGYHPEDCPECPVRDICFDVYFPGKNDAERTRLFEERIVAKAKEYQNK